jgi:micrococcal nuclease
MTEVIRRHIATRTATRRSRSNGDRQAAVKWTGATSLMVTGFVTLGIGCALPGSAQDAAPVPSYVDGANATVEYVVDGDTIDVIVDGHEERVRFTGIDTPEAARRDTGAAAECFADEATEFTRSLLPAGTPVRLERDTVGRDDYGRILAYVHRPSDGIFVNYEIIRQGYAQPLSIAPNTTYADLMVDAAQAAEADNVGLWSECRGTVGG